MNKGLGIPQSAVVASAPFALSVFGLNTILSASSLSSRLPSPPNFKTIFCLVSPSYYWNFFRTIFLLFHKSQWYASHLFSNYPNNAFPSCVALILEPSKVCCKYCDKQNSNMAPIISAHPPPRVTPVWDPFSFRNLWYHSHDKISNQLILSS